RDPAPDDLGGGVAVEPLGTGVPAGDDGVEVLADDRVVGGLDERREMGERQLRPPALGDVAEEVDDEADPAPLVRDRGGLEDRPALLAGRPAAEAQDHLGGALAAEGG